MIAGPPTSPEEAETGDDVVAEILRDLGQAFGELRCAGARRFAKQGLSMTHLYVLSMLDHHGDLTMSHLADILGVSLSNATGLVDRMEERGFVERERDREDRRVVIVRLAEGGRLQLKDAEILKGDLMAKVLATLTPGQLRCVRDALESLRGAVQRAASDPEVAAAWHAHAH